MAPSDDRDDDRPDVLAVGTGRMVRLRRGRTGFIEFHQRLARKALTLGRLGAARAALRTLRTTDFVGHPVEPHLATLRDSTATPEEVAAAAAALVALPPCPISDELD